MPVKSKKTERKKVEKKSKDSGKKMREEVQKSRREITSRPQPPAAHDVDEFMGSFKNADKQLNSFDNKNCSSAHSPVTTKDYFDTKSKFEDSLDLPRKSSSPNPIIPHSRFAMSSPFLKLCEADSSSALYKTHATPRTMSYSPLNDSRQRSDVITRENVPSRSSHADP